jgi:hypothetical protein
VIAVVNITTGIVAGAYFSNNLVEEVVLRGGETAPTLCGGPNGLVGEEVVRAGTCSQ